MNAETIVTSPSGGRWLREHVAGIAGQPNTELPIIRAADVVPMLPDHVVWDMWQLARKDGATVIVEGRSIWFFLAAPRLDDPDLRHDMARIRTFSHGADGWRDHGDTLPDGFGPGSREWSGSTVLGDDGETLTLYFTASGRIGCPRTFEQRLFETRARFAFADGRPAIGGWSVPEESVVADDVFYARADQAEAVGGMIKGFRDPGYFRDPADGAEYLLFVGSAGQSSEPFDGVIGAATRSGEGWTLLPPLVNAVGVNAELERPHVIARGGLYYLFWSTQRVRFSPGSPSGPTGLYAMVAERMKGPWRPVNGTGLVAANPQSEPFQAYCWWVTGELDVISFIDLWGLDGRDPKANPTLRAHHFGGTAAPFFRLALDGDRATIV